MRKILMIAFFCVSVSLISLSCSAASVANCPIGTQASTYPPPPGWTVSTDPLVSTSMAPPKKDVPREYYHLTAVIYSLSNQEQYFQKIFCQYQQSQNCALGNCSTFTLISQSTFKNVTPAPAKVTSLWLPYTQLENTVIFTTSPDNFSAVTFDNNRG